MKFCWCILLLTSLVCLGCSKPTPPTKKTVKTKKTTNSSPSYRAPGPASAQRDAFNKGGSNLSSGVVESYIKDLASSDTKEVKTAIEELQSRGVKSAIPKLEEIAKNHKNSDLKRRAQNAVDSLNKRK